MIGCLCIMIYNILWIYINIWYMYLISTFLVGIFPYTRVMTHKPPQFLHPFVERQTSGTWCTATHLSLFSAVRPSPGSCLWKEQPTNWYKLLATGKQCCDMLPWIFKLLYFSWFLLLVRIAVFFGDLLLHFRTFTPSQSNVLNSVGRRTHAKMTGSDVGIWYTIGIDTQ